MQGVGLYGWYGTTPAWVKMACNANGEVLLDASAIFENPPTEDETKKGASSEYIFDHAANAAAHHPKYTDVESRAAINNILSSAGQLTTSLVCAYKYLEQVRQVQLKYDGGDDYVRTIICTEDNASIRFTCYNLATGYVDFVLEKYTGAGYIVVIDQGNFSAELDNYLENPPTEDEANKAPTSEWSFDHAANVAAHHAKYTDAEAQAAVNLDGDLYWSASGANFKGANPDTDQVQITSNGVILAEADGVAFVCPVSLPNGSTVTGAKVSGDAGAQDETWTLKRVQHSVGSSVTLATAAIGTEDVTISYATIDNIAYSYYFVTSTLDTNDTIYGARITFTL